MKKDQKLKKPFFANFLENQISENEKNEIKGGAITSVLKDVVYTMKYPSDSDESYSEI